RRAFLHRQHPIGPRGAEVWMSAVASMWRRPDRTHPVTHHTEALMSSTIRVILAAAAALTAACSSTDSFAPKTPSASARADVASSNGDASVKQSVDRYVTLSCLSGETVRVTGDLRYDFHTTVDGSGVYHLSIKSSTSNLIAVG